MKVVLLIALLTVSGCDGRRVVGQTGQNVTLSCKYDIKTKGAVYVCWNRGEISSYGCYNRLLSTDGYKVLEETRTSSRYQLLGRLDEGDVSLTILNLTEEDAGRYGCRAEIPGWFNDEKHHVDLTVERAPTTWTPSKPQMSSERPVSAQTAGSEHLVVCDWTRTSCVYQTVLESEVSRSVQQLERKTTTEAVYCCRNSELFLTPKG
ncbi:hepatitis A virus cellular receptor 1 homolog isoform X4 [Poecilia reticulata]|uniref:hepatitis A virus cellular receptor 1 homolog isoform X4 n=1 Tax=Poecilia reticulata TaxID=8081 RepID=UPI0007EB6E38|nr:PREDICTED: hepatitis A virus cellular receptor 1 homolog isoform X4 [Poecilia reticulata]